MKENLLQFVWKLKMFSTQKLLSTKGETIEIISAGTENLNSGPDFFNGKISINNQIWVGNIEIHLKSSDWYNHHHEKDDRYNNVILHVVWEHDVEVFRNLNEVITTIELKDIVSENVLKKYRELFISTKKWINCENDIDSINSFILNYFFEQLYCERLEEKSKVIECELKKSNNNWEEVLFKLLAKNFGLKVNGEAFFNLANTINYATVRKVSLNGFQLEALLFGQAGLLFELKESNYFLDLKKEYEYLKAKFSLEPLNKGQIQFFRLRPNNFPTIRISQLVQLYLKEQQLFSRVRAIKNVHEYYKWFSGQTSGFWDTHFTFEKESKKHVKKLTNSFIDLLLINTIIPIKFMYFKKMGNINFNEILSLIQELKPEKNTIISNFNQLNIQSKSAFETQALLQLKTEYCNNLKCLNCAVGKELLTG